MPAIYDLITDLNITTIWRYTHSFNSEMFYKRQSKRIEHLLEMGGHFQMIELWRKTEK